LGLSSIETANIAAAIPGQPGLEPGIAGFGDRGLENWRGSGKPNATANRFKGKAKGKSQL